MTYLTRRPSRANLDNALEALLIALCVSASGYGFTLLESLPAY
jgi:hypothetical protein